MVNTIVTATNPTTNARWLIEIPSVLSDATVLAKSAGFSFGVSIIALATAEAKAMRTKGRTITANKFWSKAPTRFPFISS